MDFEQRLEVDPHPSLPTTCDAFLGGALMLHQPRQGYRAGLDAVLLAATVRRCARPAARLQPPMSLLPPIRLLDVGAGVGTVGLCAAVRLPVLDVTLVENSACLVSLADRNIALNGLAARARVVAADVMAPGDMASGGTAERNLRENGYDIVVSNPPFYETARHRSSPNALKAASHGMDGTGLDGWLRFMARMTRAGGAAAMIYRADLLPQLLAAFAPRFGELTLLPLHPRSGEPASRVIVRGIKGSRAPMRILPGITLHGAGNRFTPAIDKVLKTPAALELDASIRALDV